MIIKTANRVSNAAGALLLFALVYTVTARMQKVPYLSWLQIMLILGLFASILSTAVIVLLYCRFGMRRKLGITFANDTTRRDSHTTAMNTTDVNTTEGSNDRKYSISSMLSRSNSRSEVPKSKGGGVSENREIQVSPAKVAPEM